MRGILWATTLVVGALTAAGEDAPGPATDEDAPTPTVEEILKAEPEESEVMTTRCIGRRLYRNSWIIDPTTLLFSGRRDQYWVNTLRRPCLRDVFRRQVKNFISRSSMHLCERDEVEFLDPGGLIQTGPRCRLGRFQEISADQAQLLRRRGGLK
ncbi:MAG: hypothetical protein F4Y86_04055 [Gammaproteobacteria bacterium]|nr:hypothetical protein [Gammaproteobacteria bacterium]MYB36694.1 hypothetical protein [Gammaproteobacteria bacterium]